MRPETLCACSLLRRQSRAVSAIYDAALLPSGLRITQFSVLRALHRLGPLSITRLAEVAALDRSTMGRNLGPLQRHGLVNVGAGKGDQREHVALLTDAGKGIVKATLPRWRAAQRRVYDLIGIEAIYDLPDQIKALETLESSFSSPRR